MKLTGGSFSHPLDPDIRGYSDPVPRLLARCVRLVRALSALLQLPQKLHKTTLLTSTHRAQMKGVFDALRSTVRALIPFGKARPTPTARIDGALAAMANARAAAARTAVPSPPPGTPRGPELPSPLTSQTPLGAVASEQGQREAPASPAAAAMTARELCDAATAAYAAGRPSDASRLWMRAVSEHHDRTGAFYTALCLADGTGHLPRKPSMAVALLTPLADRVHHGWSQYALAALLIRGRVEAALGRRIDGFSADAAQIPAEERPVHADLVRARGLLEAAAAAGGSGVPPAWLALSRACELGVGAAPDTEAAVRWLRHAAGRGDPMAADAFAGRLFRGDSPGVAHAPAEAVAMWRLAAEAGGSVFAMHNLGVAYLLGAQGADGAHAVPVDLAAALVWFSRAGDAGLVRSMVNAGRLLERGGAGVAADSVAALAWYRRAEARLRDSLGGSWEGAGPGDSAYDDGVAARARTAFRDVQQRIALLAAQPAGGTSPASVAGERVGVDSGPRRGAMAESEGEGAEAESGTNAMVFEFESPAARDAALQRLLGQGGDLSVGSVLGEVQSWTASGGLASLRVAEPLARQLERDGERGAAPNSAPGAPEAAKEVKKDLK